jgi:hypothetical protein
MGTIFGYISGFWSLCHTPTGAAILLSLWGLSEALAQIPSIESNSVFQLISKGLSILKDKVKPQQ